MDYNQKYAEEITEERLLNDDDNNECFSLQTYEKAGLWAFVILGLFILVSFIL